jgi:hypothetical protein
MDIWLVPLKTKQPSLIIFSPTLFQSSSRPSIYRYRHQIATERLFRLGLPASRCVINGSFLRDQLLLDSVVVAQCHLAWFGILEIPQ